MPASAVIPHRNSGDLLARCVDALLAAEGIDEIVVADEGSTDGSVESVADRPSVRVVQSPGRGFATAANAGISAAKGARLLLVNSDAFVERDTVRRLEARLDDAPRLALCGAALIDEHGQPAKTQSEILTLGRALADALGYRAHPRRTGSGLEVVEAVLPTCALARREALEQVGGFDGRFFFYYEDTDLCRRLAQAGWEQAVDWEARAVHLTGGSTSRRLPHRWFHEYHRSRFVYLRKHYPRSWTIYAAVWVPKVLVHWFGWSLRARLSRLHGDVSTATSAREWAAAFRRTMLAFRT